MTDRAERVLVAMWAALVLATALSVALHELTTGLLGLAAVLVVTFVKVAFVGRHFMELGHAPAALRRAFATYVVVVPVGLAVIYALV